MRQLLLLLRRSPKVTSRPDAPPLHVSEGVLRFENVSFGYSSEANGPSSQLLRDVSFSIPANKKTAIVGSSGSGKSTVLKLIMRTYDPDAGRITIDGQDVRDVDMGSLRRQCGLVPQDTILFDESILYNVNYGDINEHASAALEVAGLVGLNATAERMPNGYQTRVGERGLSLSGGERQRVAIARALLKDPPLMLYDEPTSALDSLTERSVEQVLHNSAANRTSIVVAHKLKLIQDADLILVMDNGSLVEQGTHANLLCRVNSTYSRMWAQQRHGDENYFDDYGPPQYCEYVDDPLRERVQDVLALESLAATQEGLTEGASGWLW